MDIENEIVAVQLLALAIVKTHPDRAAVLAELDHMATQLQMQNAAQSSQPAPMPAALREALANFRALLSA